MYLTRNRLDMLESKVPKVISPTAHGIIDYAHAAFFFTMGVLCRRSHERAAKRAASEIDPESGLALIRL